MKSPAPNKSSTLSLIALVMASFVFLPLVPLLGGILGVIALATAKPGQSKGLAVAAISIGFSVGLVGQGCMAAITIPAFVKYMQKSKTTEAAMNLHRLYSSASTYREIQRATADNPLATVPFPESTEWTPDGNPCDEVGQRFAPRPAAWRHPTWAALQFSIDTPHYYQYRFVRTKDGFAVEARGDLNCNGVTSLFRRSATVTAADTLDGGSGLFIQNEIE